jgi:hypothetical protein
LPTICGTIHSAGAGSDMSLYVVPFNPLHYTQVELNGL